MFERYRHDDADQCFGKDFIAVDPGTGGACVIVVNGKPAEVVLTALDVIMIADAMARHQVEVMIMERQFVKMNPASALELAWRTGLAIGAVANELGDMHIVEVYPSTWQAHQKRKCGITHKLNRNQGIKLARDAGNVFLSELWQDEVHGTTKAIIEGVCSAAGIAEWWLEAQVDEEIK